MTLDQLRYFAAAASYQHIGRAANVVAISPSVISLAVTNLEAELGCKLFLREGRNIKLTHDGEKLLKKANSILSDVDSIQSELKSENLVLKGNFRFGASHFLASRHLMKEWLRFKKMYPAITADFHAMDTSQVIGNVLSGRLDYGMCFSPLKHPDLIQRRLHSGKLLIATRKKHPILKQSSKEQIEFLKENKAIFHKSNPGVDVCETHPIFEKMGFRPKIELSFDSDDIAVAHLIQSDLWSFLPDVVVEDYKDKLELIRLPRNLGEATYDITAIVHASQMHSPFLIGTDK